MIVQIPQPQGLSDFFQQISNRFAVNRQPLNLDRRRPNSYNGISTYGARVLKYTLIFREVAVVAGLLPYRRGRSLLGSNRFEDFYSLLDDFFNDMTPRIGPWRDSFRLDVREDEKEYHVEAEMPGVSKEDISLDASDNRLRIAVKRTETIDESKGDFIHRERRYGSMERSIHLAAMDEAKVSARFENGILYITVGKKEPGPQGKQIQIE